MSCAASLRRLRSALVLLACGSVASATTWIVDDGGGSGVDFTDIQSAIDAAAPGDVILVHPGVYAPFALDRGLTLAPFSTAVDVTQGSRVEALPAGQRAVVSGLDLQDLRVSACSGSVVLDRLHLDPSVTDQAYYVAVLDSLDVRVSACTVPGGTMQIFDPYPRVARGALSAVNSRVEVASSALQGEAGSSEFCVLPLAAGGPGIHKDGSFLLHVTHSSIAGGKGADGYCGVFFCEPPGLGGPGIDLVQSAPPYGALITGKPTDSIAGGEGGFVTFCNCNGLSGGFGIIGDALPFRLTGESVTGGVHGGCNGTVAAILGSVENPSPGDPYLTAAGTFLPGSLATFRVFGPPGESAQLVLGRNTALVATPGVLVESLTTRERIFQMGMIDANGVAQRQIVVPGYLTKGFVFHAQGEVTLQAGGLLRTNSATVVVR